MFEMLDQKKKGMLGNRDVRRLTRDFISMVQDPTAFAKLLQVVLIQRMQVCAYARNFEFPGQYGIERI